MLIDLTLNFTYYISVDLLVTTFYKQRKNLNTLQVFFYNPLYPPFLRGTSFRLCCNMDVRCFY